MLNMLISHPERPREKPWPRNTEGYSIKTARKACVRKMTAMEMRNDFL
jgi:hypothetical protein